MIVRSPLPSLTLQTESLSEPGTLSLVRICATTTPSNSPATFWTLSTSSPSMVSRSASCSGDQSKSTYCLSQLSVTFIQFRGGKLNTAAGQIKSEARRCGVPLLDGPDRVKAELQTEDIHRRTTAFIRPKPCGTTLRRLNQ